MSGNAETPNYTPPKATPMKTGSKASYTPSAKIDPFAFGKSAGKVGAMGSIPTVDSGTSSEGSLPEAFTGDFSIGEDKNVSTPVSG